jgi:hypothetical protein
MAAVTTHLVNFGLPAQDVAAAEHRQRFTERRLVVLGGHVAKSHLEQLGPAAAEDGAEPLVDLEPRARRVDEGKSDLRRLDGDPESFFLGLGLSQLRGGIGGRTPSSRHHLVHADRDDYQDGGHDRSARRVAGGSAREDRNRCKDARRDRVDAAEIEGGHQNRPQIKRKGDDGPKVGRDLDRQNRHDDEQGRGTTDQASGPKRVQFGPRTRSWQHLRSLTPPGWA